MDGSAGVGMKFWRWARVLGVSILGLICVSCGDQYRPVAIPIVPPPPDPQAVHFVLECVFESGANPCPPVIVGIGLGGTSDLASAMA